MSKFTYKKLSEFKNDNISYNDLLSTIEWKTYRDSILKRDNWQCQKCKKFGNEIAWELKNQIPTEIYVRKSNKVESEIFSMDNIYSDVKITLNAHHKYYIMNKKPWDYKIEALITLCSECHTNLHKTENIYIYEDERLINYKLAEKCNKCNGTGYLKEFHYFNNGICFDCLGLGFLN